MTTAEQAYDVIVLGAGSTGENVADIATRGGLSTVLVESELVGGECSYWACMPSKALLRGSEALAQARAVSGAAAAVTGEQDVAATLARRDGFTSHWDDAGQVQWVEGAGIALVRGQRLLPNLEPAAGAAVEASLREMGVDVRLGSEVRSARREDGGDVVLTSVDGEFRGDEVLVATGRAANTDEIGLETAGLESGGYLDVDESLQVPGVPWLYGVGDVNGRQQLTHMGKYQARQAGNAIVARARGQQVDLADWSPFVATADRRATPSVVFTEPQVAAVGMTAAQAADAGVPHRVVEYSIGGVAGAALFADGYSGTAIAVVDTEREVLLGVTFVGPGVAELLHSATIAVVGEVPISRLWHAVPSYPTISEVWLRLLETLRG